jgi:hypothetical protein
MLVPKTSKTQTAALEPLAPVLRAWSARPEKWRWPPGAPPADDAGR